MEIIWLHAILARDCCHLFLMIGRLMDLSEFTVGQTDLSAGSKEGTIGSPVTEVWVPGLFKN